MRGKVGRVNWMFVDNLPSGSFYYDKSQFIWRIGKGTPFLEVLWVTRLTDEDIAFLHLVKVDPMGIDCRIRHCA